MKHQVQITASKQGMTAKGVLEYRRHTFRGRLLSVLFGKRQRVPVLIPGGIVETVTIKETERESHCCQWISARF